MARFITDGVASPQTFRYSTLTRYHDIAVSNSNKAPMSGSVTLKAKKPGSDVFEAIPEGTIDLANPHSLLVTGHIAELQVEFTTPAGVANLIIEDSLR